MKGAERLKERQNERRAEYVKNAICVPLYREDRLLIEAAAKELGLTNAGFMRMVAKKYIAEMGVK